MKELVLVYDNAESAGKVINAIGHMMVGVGPRIPAEKMPKITIFSAPQALVREFRQRAYALNSSEATKTIFSDFAHTTTEGSARDHASNTAVIDEKDITYFATCLCAESELIAEFSDLLSDAQPLKGSEATSNAELSSFDIKDPYVTSTDFVADDMAKKFSIVLHKASTFSDAFYNMTRAVIALASSADLASLKLHNYPDKTGTIHPGMSEYGLVGLKASKPSRTDKLQTDIATSAAGLDASAIINGGAGNAIAVALFGPRDTVQGLTSGNISIWKGEPTADDFVKKPMAELTAKFGLMATAKPSSTATAADEITSTAMSTGAPRFGGSE